MFLDVEKYDLATSLKKKIKMKISAHFRPIFDFELRGKRLRAEPSRAELKILQLEPWLEPARLGLITSINTSRFKAPLPYTDC